MKCEECGICPESDKKEITAAQAREWTKISFLLYLLPAICVIVGFVAGYLLGGNFGGLAGAMCFLSAGFVIIKKYSLAKIL